MAAIEDKTKDLSLQKKKQKQTAGEKKSNFISGLSNAVDGEVVTRFPPEPSGYLHIGHAKAALLNQYFAQEYHGKLIIRFDDTNPTKERLEYQDAILEDLELLDVKGDKISYTSDFFEQLYGYCIQLLKEGKAYCDDTEQLQMRSERMKGVESKCRGRSPEENLRIFEEMAHGSPEGLKNCVRAKISIDSPNKALRDPVIYRCNLQPHHRTNDKFRVYPTYDFCCPIVDSIEGVTHALRTIEYRDRNDQYKWMLKALNLRKVQIWDFSRMNFIRTLLSKRKLQAIVSKGLVRGWDDPRFPTVRGIRRRGMTIEGLKKFILSQGPSKNVILLDWTSIWAVNKKFIDPVAARYVAVFATNAVKVTLSNGPEARYEESRPRHKKNADLGTKQTRYSSHLLVDQDDARLLKENEEITLMDWGNAIVEKIECNDDIVTNLTIKLHLEGDYRTTEKKITWLSDDNDVLDCELVDFDHLISKDKLEENENFEDFITPQTEFRTSAKADSNLQSLPIGESIQFERKGYFRLDQQASPGKSAQFFAIPDGKTVTKYGAKPSA